MLYAIGAGDQIIATLEHADYPEQAKTIPRVGNYARLQIEKVVQLKPDLIIAWKTGNPADDLERLKALGFQVEYSDPHALQDVGAEMLKFGQLTGNAEQAKAKTQAYMAQLADIKQRYADKPPLPVFYELWDAPLSTVAKGQLATDHARCL